MGEVKTSPTITKNADGLAAVEALRKERDAFRRNLRETFEAMCAMRDAINEYIPMPSLESDLLQGPENSVFCTMVAQSVVAELAAAKQREAGDAELLLNAYKAMLVLHRICDKSGLTAGADAANNIADQIVAAHPEIVGLASFRATIRSANVAE